VRNSKIAEKYLRYYEVFDVFKNVISWWSAVHGWKNGAYTPPREHPKLRTWD